jgi:hypothetical protein
MSVSVSRSEALFISVKQSAFLTQLSACTVNPAYREAVELDQTLARKIQKRDLLRALLIQPEIRFDGYRAVPFCADPDSVTERNAL